MITTKLSIRQGISCANHLLKVPQGSALLPILQSVANIKLRNNPLGTYVSSINGLSENIRQRLYWTYYINGKATRVLINSCKIYQDSQIEFRYGAMGCPL